MTRGAGAAVIDARSPAMCRFFSRVMRRQMRASFHAVRLARDGMPDLPEGRPAVVFSNHPSWWDPAFFIVLSSALFPMRESYGPMDAAALGRYPFMKRIGVFGVEQGTRAGATAFLRTAEAVLANSSRMLWVTAQGRFSDPRERPVGVSPGVAHLLRRRPGLLALPLALEYSFWTEKRPEAMARFGRPLVSDDAGEWHPRLEAALGDTMDALSRDVQSRDPTRFTELLRGSSGIGGVYDVWRRGRAAFRGERFEPGHGLGSRVEGGTPRRDGPGPEGAGGRSALPARLGER